MMMKKWDEGISLVGETHLSFHHHLHHNLSLVDLLLLLLPVSKTQGPSSRIHGREEELYPLAPWIGGLWPCKWTHQDLLLFSWLQKHYLGLPFCTFQPGLLQLYVLLVLLTPHHPLWVLLLLFNAFKIAMTCCIWVLTLIYDACTFLGFAYFLFWFCLSEVCIWI